jgi:enamine deaminase RidA (YjgF/YER057c/UK114 family)
MPRGTSSASTTSPHRPSGSCATLRTALAAAGAGPEHVVKWNVVVVDGQDFGSGYAAFQRAWGDRPNPPVITAAVVKGLAHPDFLVEIDAIAVVPA